jgi:hypothetical protein
MLDTTKPPQTLKDAIAQEESLRVGSNLSNLATAYSLLGEGITDMEERIEKFKSAREEIMNMNNKEPDKISLSQTKALYEKVMKLRNYY